MADDNNKSKTEKSKEKIKESAEKVRESAEDIKEDLEEEVKEKIKSYEQLIDRIQKERLAMQDELNREYRQARKYVRSHPEEGVLYSFLGGIALGFILGKLGK